MEIQVVKSKIHRAKVTEADLNYVGSITIDENLMDAANLIEHEQVHVLNYRNGERIITYVIKGARGSGIICMNGAAAHIIKAGEEIIVMGFELASRPVKAKNILVDGKNRFKRYL